jgi:prefoldin subunit 5
MISREAKRQKLQELSQQLHVLENDIQLVQQRSDAVCWPLL